MDKISEQKMRGGTIKKELEYDKQEIHLNSCD